MYLFFKKLCILTLEGYLMLIEGAINSTYWKRNIWIENTRKNIYNFRAENNNIGLFITPYMYTEKIVNKEDVPNLIGDLYFDLDSKVSVEHTIEDAKQLISYLTNTSKIPEYYIQIFFSGKKGLHIIVPYEVFGFGLSNDLHMRYRVFADKIRPWLTNQTLDMIYDARRLLRLTNSIHDKSGLYKIELLPSELSLSESEIKTMAESRRFIRRGSKPSFVKEARDYFDHVVKAKKNIIARRTQTDIKLNFIPPCIKYLFNSVSKEPGRNNRLVILANYCMNRGYEYDICLDILYEWNNRCCEPKLMESEIKHTLDYQLYRGGYSYGCTSLSEFYCEKNNCYIGRRLLDRERQLEAVEAELDSLKKEGE